MVGKILKKLACFYFVITFLMMFISVGMVAADSLTYANSGEFRAFPVLSMMQYKKGAFETFEEKVNTLNPIIHQWEGANGLADGLWALVNISTLIAFANLMLLCLLNVYGAVMPRTIKGLVLITGGLAFVPMAGLRILAMGTYADDYLDLFYPAAYKVLRMLFIPIFVFVQMFIIGKLCSKKERNTENTEENTEDIEMQGTD